MCRPLWISDIGETFLFWCFPGGPKQEEWRDTTVGTLSCNIYDIGGSEAAVACWSLLPQLNIEQMVKLDFANAFNTLRRDTSFTRNYLMSNKWTKLPC